MKYDTPILVSKQFKGKKEAGSGIASIKTSASSNRSGMQGSAAD